MIGGLIGAAVIAVVAVLAGSFNEVFTRALVTLLLIIFHALASLSFVDQTTKHQQSNFKFFENFLFAIIILSFFTSIFGVWGLLAGSVVLKLYGTYLVLLFACLHGQMLVDTRNVKSSIDSIVAVNYAFMVLVVILILPIIWVGSADNFPGFYFRIMAAFGIIDATLTILAVILHKLYIQKHPEIKSAIFMNATGGSGEGGALQPQAAPRRRIHPLLWVLGVYLLIQLIGSVLFAVLGAFF